MGHASADGVELPQGVLELINPLKLLHVLLLTRPTVAALMVFGTDLGAVNTLMATPDTANVSIAGCLLLPKIVST